MELLTKLKNRLRGLTQRWGTRSAKRDLWNKEFANGRWANIEDTSGDIVYRFIEKYSGGGSILDLGCGSGNTACELNPGCYRSYLGVDISDVALEQARSRTKSPELKTKISYTPGDIETFAPDNNYDVILFRESIYYLPNSRIKPTLDRYAQLLTKQGVMIVRWHDRKQGKGIFPVLESGRQVVEKHVPDSGPVIFVLR